jgi:hypothetical protein
MTHRRSLLIALGCCLTGTGLVRTAMAQATPQGSPPVRIRGTIDSVNTRTMEVTSRTGEKITLALAPDVGVVAIVAIGINEIKPGSYIGTAATTEPDGTLKALEIQVFPESMRGVGEGHHPWDLAPNSTMTNGTVGDVVGTDGRTLTLRYNGGEKKVVVPASAPIITYEPDSRALLTKGAHAIITATRQPDGTLLAQRIGVGKNGLTPPM